MNWQPIETAPKDGKEILVYAEDIGVCCVWWHKPSQCWVHSYGSKHVTHWMPLPTPPTGLTQAEQQLAEANAVIKQITEGHVNAGLVCELRERAIAAESALALATQRAEAAEKVNGFAVLGKMRSAWEAGFRLCRRYGDNHIHFDGDQKERLWEKYLELVNADEALAASKAATPPRGTKGTE